MVELEYLLKKSRSTQESLVFLLYIKQINAKVNKLCVVCLRFALQRSWDVIIREDVR